MTSVKYIGMDVHTEHADSPIMPTAARRQRLGGARVASRVGIIRGSLGSQKLVIGTVSRHLDAERFGARQCFLNERKTGN